MAKPTESLDFAENAIAEYIVSTTGDTVLVPNRTEPSTTFKLTGFGARTALIRQYLNYQLYALCKHVKYGYAGEIGDTYITETVATTDAEVIARFGNTWVDRGTDTLAGQSVRVFTRTA